MLLLCESLSSAGFSSSLNTPPFQRQGQLPFSELCRKGSQRHNVEEQTGTLCPVKRRRSSVGRGQGTHLKSYESADSYDLRCVPCPRPTEDRRLFTGHNVPVCSSTLWRWLPLRQSSEKGS